MSLVGELMELILYVEDIPAQVAFYRDVLEMRVKSPSGNADLTHASWVEMDSGSCTLALHAGGRRRFGEDAPKFVFRVADILARIESCWSAAWRWVISFKPPLACG